MKARKSKATVLRGGKTKYGTPQEKLQVIKSPGIWLKTETSTWAIAIPTEHAPKEKGHYLAEVVNRDGRKKDAIIKLSKFFNPEEQTFEGQTYTLYPKGSFSVNYKTAGKTNAQKRAISSKAFQNHKLKTRRIA